MKVRAQKNGFYDLLTLLSTAARVRQQYTLSRRVILFSDIDVHIAVTVILLVFIYWHKGLFENVPCQLGLSVLEV